MHGFLNCVVPVADLDREVAAYCELLVENGPLTAAAAPRSARRGWTRPRVTWSNSRMLDACFNSEDYREPQGLHGKAQAEIQENKHRR
jgi:hypothetical protein